MANYNNIPTSDSEIHPLEGFGRQRRVGGAFVREVTEIRQEWWIGKLGEMHVAETLKLAGMEAPKNGASVLQAMLREYWLDTDKVYPIPVVLARFRGWVLLARQMGGYRAELLDRIFRFPERGACSTHNRVEELIWMFRHFPSPKKIGVDHYRGIRWMMNQQLRIPRTFKSGEVRRLGRVSPWARHCLTRFHYGKGLNYSALADAQKGNRAADKVLGACVNLAARMGVGLRTVMRVSWNDWDRNGYRASDFKAEDLPKAGMLVRGMIKGDYNKRGTAAGLVLNLLAIYPDMDHMLRSPSIRPFSMPDFECWLNDLERRKCSTVIEASEPRHLRGLLHLRVSAQLIHDASMAIPARLKDIPLKQWRQWGPLLDQAPTKTISCRSRLVEIYRHLGRVPNSVEELLSVSEELFPHGTITLTEIEQDFIARTPKKDHECIPAPRGIAEGQYELRQLEYSDPRNITVGREVDCCQHLGGVGRRAAEGLWKFPTWACWVLFQSGTPIAQAAVFRSKDDSITLDSVECLGGQMNNPIIPKLFLRAAQDVVGRMGVWAVFVSNSTYGCTGAVALSGKNHAGNNYEQPAPIDHPGYLDAGRLVGAFLAVNAVTYATQKARARAAVKEVKTDHNTLMPGSGVYCEHCEAEVDPMAEICPTCGEDISEWVD